MTSMQDNTAAADHVDLCIIGSGSGLSLIDDDINDWQIALIDNKKIVMSGDVDSIKEEFHKYQIGFSEPPKADAFDELTIMHREQIGNVYTLVVKGDASVIKQTLQGYGPVLLTELPLNLEEIFVYEMEARGYGKSI